MKRIFSKLLFTKNFLVGRENTKNAFEVFYALANKFGIYVVAGKELLYLDNIKVAEDFLDRPIGKPFYRNFPESVKKMAPNTLLFEQLLHYFGAVDSSVFEEQVKKSVFTENFEPKKFKVVTEDEAKTILVDIFSNMAISSRPWSEEQFEAFNAAYTDGMFVPTEIACKDNAIKLFLQHTNKDTAKFIKTSDVIRLVEILEGVGCDLKKLHLSSKNRRLVSMVLDATVSEHDIEVCSEKKKVWCGLLHHIHYKPKNEGGKAFCDAMRGKKNYSAYSEFERLMNEDAVEAARYLKNKKGSNAVIRMMDYLLSRASILSINEIFDCVKDAKPIVLLQYLVHLYTVTSERFFVFVKQGLVKVHCETEDEIIRRGTVLSDEILGFAKLSIKQMLNKKLKKFNKVYVDETMKNIALPLNAPAGNTGMGTLPTGSVINVPKGKKVRAFTYWEKVNDIDLSVIGIADNGKQKEFSWRSFWGSKSSDALCFSGDVTNGYNGGAEYFDVDIDEFKKLHPDMQYLVFCDNVYTSCTHYCDILCKAGIMFRDTEESGEIFEPKTVKTSFDVTAKTNFVFLFAIDLCNRRFVWLNMANAVNSNVAGENNMSFLLNKINLVDIVNLYDFAIMSGNEIVSNPEDADVIFSDTYVSTDKTVYHSYDTEALYRLLEN